MRQPRQQLSTVTSTRFTIVLRCAEAQGAHLPAKNIFTMDFCLCGPSKGSHNLTSKGPHLSYILHRLSLKKNEELDSDDKFTLL